MVIVYAESLGMVMLRAYTYLQIANQLLYLGEGPECQENLLF